ncbi:MAG: transglycosylase domain-containing protein [Myxococcales bacterium]|nr:transglycosylase domain-containing protein [Myxococcales bacterium]
MSRRTTAVQDPPPESGMWVAAELLTWVLAIAAGLTITAGLLWMRARSDVAAYLAAPPRTVESTVWSAPMVVRKGMPANVGVLEGDLLAAGYERVESVSDSQDATGDGVGLFSLHDGTFDIWTSLSEPVPGVLVDEGRTTLTVKSGKVAKLSRERVTLPPTVLGVVTDLDTKRERVDLSSMSTWVEPALLSMEDVRFRQHNGVDPIGILRAIFTNATTNELAGGSTLTQQLAKNLFLSKDRTIRRKVREVFFAAALESHLTKDQLLELYLREVYLGQMGGLPLHGVEQASLAWFGKGASRLDLHEAALIVGVIPAPNTYSPIRHEQAALERRNLVLQRMHDLGEITEQDLERAKAKPIKLSGLPPSKVRRAPYAVDAAIERVEGELGQGALSRGVHLHTTIHPLLQRAAEEAVAEGMAELDEEYPKAAGAQVALVAVRIEDGAVVAMVGGRSYADSAFNRAVDAKRQVGSTIKPLTLVKALYDGVVTPSTRLSDEPMTMDLGTELWSPKNYDGKFEGEVSLRRTIEASRNIPAVHLAEHVGMARLQRFYQATGLSESTGLPSAALGSFAASPLEMAGAYTLFGHGVAHRPEVVQEVRTVQGDPLLTIEPLRRQVVDDRAATQAMDVLRGVITSGTGARARRYGIEGHVGGKTGTTDEYRDAWFVGLTPELAVAVWVGRDRGTLGLSGSRGALPTWARFVEASGTQHIPAPSVPGGLQSVELCATSGLPARDVCDETVQELFSVGSVPDDKCDEHGGPGVQLGRLFGGLFKKRKKRDEDGEVIGEGEDRTQKRRRRRPRPEPAPPPE